ncbi:MAG: hypothetical protein O3B84_03795 [Chloroflexi bacterium]|nr:hypothetical protein [Chloroflexota bacterium]
MKSHLVAVGLVTVAAAGVSTLPVLAQTTWSVPRTADNQPDLQGVWDFRTITPFERPQELAGKAVMTPEEAAAFREETLRALNKDQRASDGISIQRDVANAYNEFWWDYGDRLTEDGRTSLVFDPPDGRIPALTPEAEQRAASSSSQAFEATRSGVAPANSWTDMDLGDRCILGFNSGPPMTPSAYNNNVQIFQARGYVAILNEMVHNTRIVPLDGRPHLPAEIRQWVGDSRGYWDGDTLVVETSHFLGETGFVRGASGADLNLVERFTRVSDGTLLYEVAVEDPGTWSRPWKFAVPMVRSESQMFEYACHEGNYGMTNLLAGSRAQDVAADGKSSVSK